MRKGQTWRTRILGCSRGAGVRVSRRSERESGAAPMAMLAVKGLRWRYFKGSASYIMQTIEQWSEGSDACRNVYYMQEIYQDAMTTLYNIEKHLHH